LQGGPKHTGGALTKSSPTRRFPSFFALGIIAHSLKYNGLLCPAPIKPHPVAFSPACRHHPAPRHRLVRRRCRRRFAGVKPDRRKPPPPASLQRRAEAPPLFIGLVPPPEHRRPRRHEPAAQAPPSAAPSSNPADSICLHHGEPLYNHPLDLLFQFDASAGPETAQGAGDPNNQSPPVRRWSELRGRG
jgi:hypothetical protein